MLTKKELDILESGLIYEELHGSDVGTSDQDEWVDLMKSKILAFNKEHETNFNPEVIIDNYIFVKRTSDFSPLRPKPQRQKVRRKKF